VNLNLNLASIPAHLLLIALLLAAGGLVLQHTNVGNAPHHTANDCVALCHDQGTAVKRWESFACECLPPPSPTPE